MTERRPRVLTLSPKESLILDLLIEEPDLYGLQLVHASKRQLKRGTIYVTLGRMEEKGYVVSRLESVSPGGGGLPRRLYRSTPLGRRVRAVWNRASAYLIPEFAQ